MWMLVHPTHLVLSSETLSNEIFCGSFLIQNHVICVPTIKVKWILFLDHRNRKLVGGKQNVLIYYVNVCAPDPPGVVVWNPFIWDILCSFLIQNHVICVPAIKAKWILFIDHRKRKLVWGKHNVLVHCVDASAPDPSGVVRCNTFKWDILLCVHVDFNRIPVVRIFLPISNFFY